MKTKQILAASACIGIILAPLFAQTNTNRVAIPSPDPRIDAPERSEMPGRTNSPPALQSTPTTVLDAKTMTWIDWSKGTNDVMALPYVQSALLQAFQQGVQFGVAAGIQNRTLVDMQDAQALQRAAMWMRFGNQKGAR